MFTEEVAEIIQTLGDLFPQWNKDRHDHGLLVEIRRGFHTLKGSGRMAGAFALGDFAWAHESLLNQVLSGQLPANDRVASQVHNAIQELAARQVFFQTAEEKDAGVETMVAVAEAIMAGEDEQTPVFQAALPPKPTVAITSKIIAPDGWLVDDAADSEEEVLDFSSPVPSAVIEPEPEPEPFFLQVTDSVELEVEMPDAVDMDEAEEADADTLLVWQLFWEEVPDQLASLDQNLQRLREDPSDHESIRALEREFHTLKGGARMAQVTPLADVSHEAENLLNRLAAGSGIDPSVLETLQTAIDNLHSLAETCQKQGIVKQLDSLPAQPPVMTDSLVCLTDVPIAGGQVPEKSATPVAEATEPAIAESVAETDSREKLRGEQGEFSSLLERMLAEQANSLPDISVLGMPVKAEVASVVVDDSKAASHETIRLPAAFVDRLIDRAVGLNVQQIRMSEYFNGMGGDVAELGRTVARLRQQIRALELESEAQIHDGRHSRTASRATADGFDPLEMDQYAEIQRISRSLAESLNDLVNLEADLNGQLHKGEQLLQEDMRTTRQIQQDLLETRLVALTVLVPRLRRLTRQTATELGKQVTLEVQGEECELDRNLLQNMTAPLEHLIRNALAHGIEMPAERERLGKPPAGRIMLSVSRDDAEIVIRFRDDGKGLDRQQLRRRGLELGFVQPGQMLPDSEIDRLILRTGFTTAASVSQIAGRGVGMDVVYSELKALGGSLQIESETGKGLEFIMRLPFTLMVNPVLLAEVQGQVFALPIGGIQGLARLSGADIQRALDAGSTQLEFAGQPYRLCQLAEQLGAGGVITYVPDEMYPVVFINLQEQAIAWVIEHVQGRREVVLQPLGVLFKECRLYSAATVAPDGSVFLVPDMTELARRVMQTDAAETIAFAEEADVAMVEEFSGPPRILVVDDSVTVRRVTEKFLNAREYVVATAKDGMEALERVGEFLPDAVLLDIEMPRMDGFELLGHLRRDPQWRNLPVVMISSRTAPKHREHALSLGATRFLGKPYQNEILLDTLQGVLASGHINPEELVPA
ncbi:MAG TPA: Hpt domain-containing protein [Candidatus Thiothrix moscowensis]|uniref:hybrid sensor histidine kinase/response regulator n=1 Tax=Thiothrix sp. UBA2016 TaxID=1947695 RepID=UPI0025EBA075|nr:MULTISPECIES: Hpt domain-containing protein [unclassified Thiothrix]HRJ54032.1 Hpt domain-containing protein [Candidatus Thiothrix moscowensis]HRJ94114.1 Hpt domain-containing protein [Candidatus Thiothrix moscowensis]